MLKSDRSALDYFTLSKRAKKLAAAGLRPLRVAVLGDAATQHLITLMRALFASNGSRVALDSPHTALEQLTKRFRGSLAPRVDDRGWYRVPDEDRWGLGVEQAHGRLAVHHGFMKEKYFQGNVERLEQLITVLRGRGIDVVLVTTPVWETYRTGMRQDRWSRTTDVIDAMVRKYGVRYLNYQTEPRMNADDFEDADHLNADGAVKFARLLEQAMGPLRGREIQVTER